MRKRIEFVVLLIALGGLGCSTMNPLGVRHEEKEKPKVVTPPPPPAPVTADSVTDTNAAERAKALREEMFRETRPRSADTTNP
jgi:hypothetical protein